MLPNPQILVENGEDAAYQDVWWFYMREVFGWSDGKIEGYLRNLSAEEVQAPHEKHGGGLTGLLYARMGRHMEDGKDFKQVLKVPA